MKSYDFKALALSFLLLVFLIQEADRHVVNCVQPHPYEPLIASSGIDYNVKLWAPISNELTFDEVAAKTVLHLIKDFYLNY